MTPATLSIVCAGCTGSVQCEMHLKVSRDPGCVGVCRGVSGCAQGGRHGAATPGCTWSRVRGFVLIEGVCAVSFGKKRRTPDGGTQACGKRRDWPSGGMTRRTSWPVTCMVPPPPDAPGTWVWGFVLIEGVCVVSFDKKRRTPDGATQACGKRRDWPSGNVASPRRTARPACAHMRGRW